MLVYLTLTQWLSLNPITPDPPQSIPIAVLILMRRRIPILALTLAVIRNLLPASLPSNLVLLLVLPVVLVANLTLVQFADPLPLGIPAPGPGRVQRQGRPQVLPPTEQGLHPIVVVVVVVVVE